MISFTLVRGTNCRKFYSCMNNKINVLSCQEGLLFDTVLRRCNYANSVFCSETDLTKNKSKLL